VVTLAGFGAQPDLGAGSGPGPFFRPLRKGNNMKKALFTIDLLVDQTFADGVREQAKTSGALIAKNSNMGPRILKQAQDQFMANMQPFVDDLMKRTRDECEFLVLGLAQEDAEEPVYKFLTERIDVLDPHPPDADAIELGAHIMIDRYNYVEGDLEMRMRDESDLGKHALLEGAQDALSEVRPKLTATTAR
jgi:hypothetical protein